VGGGERGGEIATGCGWAVVDRERDRLGVLGLETMGVLGLETTGVLGLGVTTVD